MTPMEVVLSRLVHVTKAHEGYLGRCPAHNHRTPNLSIGEGDDGRVLLHCWAGCETAAICRISTSNAYESARSGWLRGVAVKCGAQWRVPRDRLRRLIEGGEA